MGPLDRLDQPPKPGPEIEIRRLRKNESVCFTIMGALEGVYTHWNGMRSEPCFANHRECPGHLKALPRRWKGYIHVHDDRLREEQFLELTPLAAKCLLNSVGHGTVLRGIRLTVTRLNGNKARLTVAVLESVQRGVVMPAPKSVYPVLANLWNLPEGKDLWGGDSGLPEGDETE